MGKKFENGTAEKMPVVPDKRDYAFTSGRTVPVPVELFDKLLPELTSSEIKSLLYISRRTLGFRKLKDRISNKQFTSGLLKRDGTRLDYGAGISERRLAHTLKGLRKKHLIRTKHETDYRGGNLPTRYVLNFSPEATAKLESTLIIKKEPVKIGDDMTSSTPPAAPATSPSDMAANRGAEAGSDHNIKDPNKDIKEKKKPTSPPANAGAPLTKEQLSKVVGYWNKNKGSKMAPVENLHSDRVKQLQRIAANYSMELIEKAIDNAGNSSFLNGHNERGWVAGFDFIIRDESTFVKVLEGNYSGAKTNKTKVTPARGKYDGYK